MTTVKTLALAAFAAFYITGAKAEPVVSDLEIKRLKLFALHQVCNDALEANRLNSSDYFRCQIVYATLKLSFLDKADLATYQTDLVALPSWEQLAYLAYRAWLEATDPDARLLHLATLNTLVDA